MGKGEFAHRAHGADPTSQGSLDLLTCFLRGFKISYRLAAGMGSLGPGRVGFETSGAQLLDFLETDLFQGGIFRHAVPFFIKKPRAPDRMRGACKGVPQTYSTFMTRTLNVPPGASTETSSPARWFRIAFPIGDSFEIFPSRGLASAAPTMK